MPFWMRRRSGVNKAAMSKGGDDGDDRRLLPADRGHQALQQHHAAKIDQPQGEGQRAVDQRLADDDVDVPQPVAQD